MTEEQPHQEPVTRVKKKIQKQCNKSTRFTNETFVNSVWLTEDRFLMLSSPISPFSLTERFKRPSLLPVRWSWSCCQGELDGAGSQSQSRPAAKSRPPSTWLGRDVTTETEAGVNNAKTPSADWLKDGAGLTFCFVVSDFILWVSRRIVMNSLKST